MNYKTISVGVMLIALCHIPAVMAAKMESAQSLTVKATAFTSLNVPKPLRTAWGDRLEPGIKAIAVSRDLLNEFGLKRNTKVKISGLEGEYLVLDKMHKRWEKKIDIYMGDDHSKALRFGYRKVKISW